MAPTNVRMDDGSVFFASFFSLGSLANTSQGDQIMGRTYEEMAAENLPYKPEVDLKLGEHLSWDTREKVWKVWGRDERGIYARTVTK